MIKFTAEWSRESVTLLNTKVISDGNPLVTDLYTKPNDTHQYRHQRSCYPFHCKSSIAYSQALWMQRICSRPTDYQQHIAELKENLVRRGHDWVKVAQGIEKATRILREQSLIQQTKKVSEKVTPLVVTFHPDLPHLMRILRDHQCVIDISPRLREALPKCPLVAYHHPPNLRDLLVREAFKQQREMYKGNSPCTPCKHPHCKTCIHIKTGITISSTITGTRFCVKATACCGTSNVVYLIECRQCAFQYVGETGNALHVRLTGHRSEINHRRIKKPVAKHFSLPDYSMDNLKVMVIEKIHREDSEYRKWKESCWIEMIRSLTPEGLNLNS